MAASYSNKKSTSKARGKAENTALAKLKQSIKDQNPGTLYFFSGEETYLRDIYVNRLRSLLVEDGMEAFNLHEFQGKDINPDTFPQELSDAVDTFPMMSERTMILVYDVDIFKVREELKEQYVQILANLPEYVCVVFVYDIVKPDKRTISGGTLGKLVKKQDCFISFEKQSGSDLNAWIVRQLRPFGKTIDRDCCEYLTFITGGLMTTMAAELEKIGAYAKGEQVTRADIDAVTIPVLDAVAFNMTDAIGSGKFSEAGSILADLLTAKQEPIMILGALGKQLRQLYTARVAIERGKGGAWLMEIWGMKSEYPAGKLMNNARRFPAPWYREAVRLAGETDLILKSSPPSEGPGQLTLLLAKLAEAAHAC